MDSTCSTLAEALQFVRARKAEALPSSFLTDLRADLEAAARSGLGAIDRPSASDPIRLPKRRVEELLACERRAVALAHSEADPDESLVVGTLLDLLVNHHVLGGQASDEPFGLAQELLAASALDDPNASKKIHWLEALENEECEALRDGLAARSTQLLQDLPVLDGWEPRIGERVTVLLADGEVVVSGRLDISLGGAPLTMPLVAVEIKGGRTRPAHRADNLLYGLLLALRDASPPAAVITWTAADAGVLLDFMTADALRTATRRLTAAIHIATSLAGGRTPRERPSWRCNYCTESHRCPSAFGDEAA